MDTIPREIYATIFTLLNESDWVQCSNVCRSWRVVVPFAVAKLWQHLDVNCETLSYLSVLRHFPSVQSVKLEAISPLPILPAGQITQLELLHQSLNTTASLVLDLQAHVPYLQSLALAHCQINTSEFTNILNACPNLMHFSLRIQPRWVAVHDQNADHHHRPLLPAIKKKLRLVSLELSTGIANVTIKSILGWCPDLQILKLDPRCLHPRPTCQEILELCPKLSHLLICTYFESIFDHGWSQVGTKDGKDGQQTLRCLRLDREYMMDRMVPQLLQTVEVLQVPALSLQGISIGSEHLKVFVCDHAIEAQELVHLFRHSPRLEKIIIYATTDDFIFIDPNVLEAAKSLTCLTGIRLPLWIASDIASQFLKPFESRLLELCLCGIKDTSSLDFLKGFTSLAHLEICDRRHGQSISLLVLKHLPALKHIKLVYFEDLDQESMVILENLVSIELVECGKAACERFATSVNRAYRLQQVKIAYDWSPHGLKSLTATCRKRNIKLILEEISW